MHARLFGVNIQMKTTFLTILTGILLGASTAPVLAGSATGKITHLSVSAGSVARTALNGTHTGIPACSVAATDFGFAIDTPTGKAFYLHLLAAELAGKTVTITGDGTCNNPYGNRENIVDITLWP